MEKCIFLLTFEGGGGGNMEESIYFSVFNTKKEFF